MRCSTPSIPATLALIIGLVLIGACDEGPAAPDPALDALGHDDGTVTLPMEIHWGEGTFVVVPFDDPRVPDDTPVENCPDDGQANPELGLPAGFPNGGGIVISRGDGQARHLGHLTEFSTRCAVQFFPATDPPLVNFDLRGTVIGADGDRIFVRAPFAKTGFTPDGVPDPQVEVVGGTGRFEGASGQLTPTRGLEVTCTDDSGLCLEGTWSGGFVEGEITIPRP
jgi:hypothetical protein